MAATKLYLRNTQTGGGTGGTVYDLSTTQGTGATLSASVSSNTFAEVLRFQFTLGTDVPASGIPFSISINAISAQSEVQWRIQELNSSNTVVASSSYATAQTTTGTKTGTISFSNSWSNGDRIAISVEYRRTGGTGSRTLTLDINSASTYIEPDLAPPTQALTATLYSNSNDFYGPTVTRGAVSLTPALYSNSNTFYAAIAYRQFLTVQQDFGLITGTPDVYDRWGLVTDSPVSYTNDLGDLQAGGATQNLTAALYTNTNTFYGPTVTAGAVALTPSLYSNANTFYGPSVTVGAVTLTPSLYSNTNTFYSPSVTVGAVTLTPSLYSNDNTFYGPTVTVGAVTLTPSLYSNDNTFYGPAVTVGAVTLTPDLYANDSTFYGPTVTVGAVTLTPDLYTNGNTFYSVVVTIQGGPAYVAPDLYTNDNTFYGPTVTTGSVTLAPELYENTNIIYFPTVSAGGDESANDYNYRLFAIRKTRR